MNKKQVIERIEKHWAEFKQSFADLPQDRMTSARPGGGWSVKDIIVHVRAWEEEALKYLPAIEKGERLPRYKDLYGGIDAFNALTYEAHKDLPLETALANLEDTHKRLIQYLESVPEELFGGRTRFRRRLSADTYKHYPEHTETILKFTK